MLQTRLNEARNALDEAHGRRREALLAANPDPSTDHDRSCRVSEDLVSGLEDAVIAVDEQITAGEGKLVSERDRVARETEADKCQQQAKWIETAAKKFNDAADTLAHALEPVGAVTHSTPFAPLLRGTAADLTARATSVAAQARSYAARVADGSVAMQAGPAACHAQPSATALHEAGHVTAAVAFRKTVKLVCARGGPPEAPNWQGFVAYRSGAKPTLGQDAFAIWPAR